MAITSRFTEAFTVTRFTTGKMVNGHYIPGQPTTFTATGSIQPLTGIDLVNAPEAQRTKETVRIYSDITLNTADDTLSIEADIITRASGKKYQIQEVSVWSYTSKAHCESRAVRYEAPEGI